MPQKWLLMGYTWPSRGKGCTVIQNVFIIYHVVIMHSPTMALSLNRARYIVTRDEADWARMGRSEAMAVEPRVLRASVRICPSQERREYPELLRSRPDHKFKPKRALSKGTGVLPQQEGGMRCAQTFSGRSGSRQEGEMSPG